MRHYIRAPVPERPLPWQRSQPFLVQHGRLLHQLPGPFFPAFICLWEGSTGLPPSLLALTLIISLRPILPACCPSTHPTVSTTRPSCSCSKNLRVPSGADTWRMGGMGCMEHDKNGYPKPLQTARGGPGQMGVWGHQEGLHHVPFVFKNAGLCAVGSSF